MNGVIENILTRRSVRAFTDKEISKEDIDLLVKAALYAPSARNLQTWRFTVLTKKDDIKALSEAIGKVLERDGYNMYNPSLVIIPSNKKDSPYGRDDNACALENIFLAAHSMGIGSVWINQLNGISDDPEIRKILNRFEIPEEHIIFGIAALGYSAEEEKKQVEKIGEVRIF